MSLRSYAALSRYSSLGFRSDWRNDISKVTYATLYEGA